MKDQAKERLRKVLTAIYYLTVAINYVFPVCLIVISGIALSRINGLHWTIRWTILISFLFSVVELASQIKRTLKLNKK